MTTDRIVVFDDPVSSLDSDILFIVGSLIKGLFDEVRTGTGHIKQVFVFTHNVYFHKEVTFNPKRRSNEAMRSEETFWVVRKSDTEAGRSVRSGLRTIRWALRTFGAQLRTFAGICEWQCGTTRYGRPPVERPTRRAGDRLTRPPNTRVQGWIGKNRGRSADQGKNFPGGNAAGDSRRMQWALCSAQQPG